MDLGFFNRLLYLQEHQYLLKHPVITSFLWLKWARIRRYFNRNLRFFALFVMVHTWYVFEQFGGESIRGGDGRVQGWPLVFILFSVAMLAMVVMDWVLDIQDLGKCLILYKVYVDIKHISMFLRYFGDFFQ